MKKKAMFYIYLVFTISLIFNLSLSQQAYGNWVAKINKSLIYTKDFQTFVEIQKNNLGKKNTSLQTPAEAGLSLGEVFLKKYIENQIILIEASKKGYDKNQKEIKKVFKEKKNKWLTTYFINQQIDISQINIKEKDVEKFYSSYKKKAPNAKSMPKYSKLKPAEKYQMKEATGINEYQKLKRAYFSKLEKKYKVKYHSLNSKVVAKVKGTSIKQKELEKELSQALNLLGISAATLQKERPKDYADVKNEMRTTMVANLLAKYEMKTQKFVSQNTTIKALEYFLNDIILQTYIQKEIFSKIQVTEQEIETAFQKNKAALKKQKWTLEQIESYLQNRIRQEKGQTELLKFIQRKKEESIILRNPKEIKKLT